MQNKTLYTSLTALALGACVACASDASSAGNGRYASVYPGDGYGYGQPVGSAATSSAAAQAGSNGQLDPQSGPDVRLADAAAFKQYLTDGQGRALYLFANDIPGSNSSQCSAACLEKWPVFDAKQLAVGTGLSGGDFSRFQRADGTWQTAFKGHPLYRFATDAAGSVQGDGVGGRWYVARDYTVFVAAKSDLTPQGASMPAPYMTNRAGRTVYVFMNDTAGNASTAPSSACDDQCLASWPAWAAPAMLDSMVLPSSMQEQDFGLLERSVAGKSMSQLTYRGYPLYFHTPDVAPGQTSGHGSAAWRAIDPKGFASDTP